MSELKMNTPNYTLDYLGRNILKRKDVIAPILPALLPEEFFGLDLKKIINYLPTSEDNPDHVTLLDEEFNTFEGGIENVGFQFEVSGPSGKTYIINLKFWRNSTNSVKITAEIYSVQPGANQKLPKLKDNDPAFSGKIDFNPPTNLKNSIIETTNKRKYIVDNICHEAIGEILDTSGYLKTVDLNIGGPEYDDYNWIIKFVYDLFHYNEEELEKFYEERNIYFNEEVLN